MPPSFTSPPQFLEVPAYPLIQPIFFGVPGPYKHASTLYWVFLEDSGLSAVNAQLVAYSNTSPTAAQPSTRIAPGSPININGLMVSVTYPGTGTLIYVTYVEYSTDLITFVTFDISTGTWGTPNSSGTSNIGNVMGWQLANGNFQIVYNVSGSPDTIWGTFWNGASWSSPAQFTPADANYYRIMTGVSLPSSLVGLWYREGPSSISTTSIKYSYITAGSFTGTATASTHGDFINDSVISSFYDPNSDTAACAVIENGQTLVDLLLTSPSASTTVSVVTVFTDSGRAHRYDNAVICGNAAGNLFELLIWDTVDNLLQIFESTALTTGWSVSPSTYYDQSAHDPSPAPSGPEIFPDYALFLGSQYVVTAGFLCAVGADPPFCGVMAAMIPGSPLSLTCPSSSAQVGVPYSSSFVATGGTPPDTFAIIAGALPPGLTLNTSTGLVSGTPTAFATYSYTGQVTDSLAATATASCSIVVAPPPLTLACPTSVATVGVAYISQLVAAGGAPPYTFAIISGSLPPGLNLNTSTGFISGTPTGPGTSSYTAQVTDSLSATAMSSCSIAVGNCGPTGITGGQTTPVR